jgi:hypothetical protein
MILAKFSTRYQLADRDISPNIGSNRWLRAIRDDISLFSQRAGRYGLGQTRRGSLARTVPVERPYARILTDVVQKSTRTRNSTVNPPRAPACVCLVQVVAAVRTVTRTRSRAWKSDPRSTSGRSFTTRRVAAFEAYAGAATAATSRTKATERAIIGNVLPSKHKSGDIVRPPKRYIGLLTFGRKGATIPNLVWQALSLPAPDS